MSTAAIKFGIVKNTGSTLCTLWWFGASY